MDEIKKLIMEELSNARTEAKKQNERLEELKAHLSEDKWKRSLEALSYNIRIVENEVHRLDGVIKTLEWVLGDEIKRMYNDLNTKL